MSSSALAVKPKLSQQLATRNIDSAQWHTLSKSLFPGAKPDSVLLVIDYCQARKLDPMKKPCHIVPMRVKDANTGNYEYRDVVMPGIYEYRTTANRTGEYLGHAIPTYGELKTFAGVTAPEWCAFTAYRWNPSAKFKAEYPVVIYFSECVATKRDGTANERWKTAPRQMLTKCAEAAALREAFPDELGGQVSAEEMIGQHDDFIEGEAVNESDAKLATTTDKIKASLGIEVSAEVDDEPAGLEIDHETGEILPPELQSTAEDKEQ